MKKRTIMVAINWIMLISLIVVFGSGMLLKVMPGMWMGITHAVSGLLLVITAIVHMLQHGMLKKSSKK